MEFEHVFVDENGSKVKLKKNETYEIISSTVKRKIVTHNIVKETVYKFVHKIKTKPETHVMYQKTRKDMKYTDLPEEAKASHEIKVIRPNGTFFYLKRREIPV